MPLISTKRSVRYWAAELKLKANCAARDLADIKQPIQILLGFKLFSVFTNFYITKYARHLDALALFLANLFVYKSSSLSKKAVRISARRSLAPSLAH